MVESWDISLVAASCNVTMIVVNACVYVCASVRLLVRMCWCVLDEISKYLNAIYWSTI